MPVFISFVDDFHRFQSSASAIKEKKSFISLSFPKLIAHRSSDTPSLTIPIDAEDSFYYSLSKSDFLSSIASGQSGEAETLVQNSGSPNLALDVLLQPSEPSDSSFAHHSLPLYSFEPSQFKSSSSDSFSHERLENSALDQPSYLFESSSSDSFLSHLESSSPLPLSSLERPQFDASSSFSDQRFERSVLDHPLSQFESLSIDSLSSLESSPALSIGPLENSGLMSESQEYFSSPSFLFHDFDASMSMTSQASTESEKAGKNLSELGLIEKFSSFLTSPKVPSSFPQRRLMSFESNDFWQHILEIPYPYPNFPRPLLFVPQHFFDEPKRPNSSFILRCKVKENYDIYCRQLGSRLKNR